jgi:hypothetical protein|tara:strand:- start:3837 stop:4121 length:285 start_codon:yes stop_codon:yes gene_type:complete
MSIAAQTWKGTRSVRHKYRTFTVVTEPSFSWNVTSIVSVVSPEPPWPWPCPEEAALAPAKPRVEQQLCIATSALGTTPERATGAASALFVAADP